MSFLNIPIITLAIVTPLIGAFLIAFANYSNSHSFKRICSSQIGILFSLLTFAITLKILWDFDFTQNGYQFEEYHLIASNIGLAYHMGIDGISILFIVLTAFLVPLCFIFACGNMKESLSEYVIAFLIMDSLVIACFASVNLLLFYIFFEAMLIPMYLIIGCFGGKNRIYASFKFFLYTFLASIFFLIALIYIYIKLGTFDMRYMFDNAHQISKLMPSLVWVAIFVAMAVKVPMVPFHTWLPDAHVEAPTSGSVILAGILLKVGGYGMVRILIQILPDISQQFAPIIIPLSAMAIIYASFVALAQEDMKKMIAYSSVAHMGYVTGGIFSMNMAGFEGAMLQMVSHGLISAGLFFVVGMLYDRMNSKSIKDFGGVAARMPILATFFMILVMASIGLPGTSGFIAEFLSLVGIFQYDIYIALICAFGVVLGAIYMLSLYKRVMFGEITDKKILKIEDIKLNESFILGLLCLLVILIGIAPEYLLQIFRLGMNGLL